MKKLNDTLLVSRAALLGDRKAFNQLVEAYQSPVRRLFFNLTGGDAEQSKDLAQDTFVKAWLNVGNFRAASGFSTWLYRIAYNTFYDYSRAGRQVVSSDAETVSVHTNSEDFSMDFARALSCLAENERTVALLFYMEDLTVEKISGIMNCPVGTVKSHLFRSREKLSAYFKNSGYSNK